MGNRPELWNTVLFIKWIRALTSVLQVINFIHQVNVVLPQLLNTCDTLLHIVFISPQALL